MNKKRQAVWDKTGGRCFYCGIGLSNSRWHEDHFHPVLRYDGVPLYKELDVECNKVPACAPCNNFKSSNSVEGYRRTIAEQFENTLKNSTGLRQLNRMGVVDLSPKPIVFYFEEAGISVPSVEDIYGISDKAKSVEWKFDKVEQREFASVGGRMVSFNKHHEGGYLIISTDGDWNQERTVIPPSPIAKLVAAEWALKVAERHPWPRNQ